MENVGKKDHYIREMREYCCQKILKSKNVSRGSCKRKASRSTGPVAAGIASQGVIGASATMILIVLTA